MNNLIRKKLNYLLNHWPSGVVVLSSWLRGQGYSNPLVNQYRKSGWVQSLGRDANVRPNDKVNWLGGLYAIQEQLKLPAHVGGKTALELQGYAHFLPSTLDPTGEGLGDRSGYGGGIGSDTGSLSGSRADSPLVATVFTQSGVKLPHWFLHHDWRVGVKHVMTNMLPYKNDLGLTQKNMGTFSVKIATPERAILELLHLVPNSESYEEAKLLMEGLQTLRPELMQTLLVKCKSVKVNRLFMHLAELCKLPCLAKINLKKINFGKGKRVLVKGGYFDAKYQISVPGENPVDGVETQ